MLITGAASGIGELRFYSFLHKLFHPDQVEINLVVHLKQISYEYAKRGSCLVLVDIREDRLGAVVDNAKNLGSPDVITVVPDVPKVEDSERFVNAAVDHFGRCMCSCCWPTYFSLIFELHIHLGFYEC